MPSFVDNINNCIHPYMLVLYFKFDKPATINVSN